MSPKTLSGKGELRHGAETLGIVEYKITTTEGQGWKSARGTIWGDPMVLHTAFEQGDVTMIRQDNGFEMRIVVSSHNFDGSAAIAVSGPPGPE